MACSPFSLCRQRATKENMANIQIDKTTPNNTFKKQLEEGLGKKLNTDDFHAIWNMYFAPSYDKLTLMSLDEHSNCTLCGHAISKQIGIIERTGQKTVQMGNHTVTIPDSIRVGCDCYGLKSTSVIDIIDKIQDKFPGIKVPLWNGKLNFPDLVMYLYKYREDTGIDLDGKFIIPVKYIDFSKIIRNKLQGKLSQYARIADILRLSDYNNCIVSDTRLRGWKDVYYGKYDKPIKNKKTLKVDSGQHLKNIVLYCPESIIIFDLNIVNKIYNNIK